MKKKVLILLLCAGFLASSSLAEETLECDPLSHNVRGFAESSGIGLISLSCTNKNEFLNYGVSINKDNTLSGYAYSPAIGTISFNADEICEHSPCIPSDFPSSLSNHTARIEYVSPSLAKITGFARALSACDFKDGKCTTNKAGENTGGWDGWIKFDSLDGAYNTFIKQEGLKYRIQGNAWGGDLLDQENPPSIVLGEIRFTQAETSFNPNYACPQYAPVADFKLGCRNGVIDSNEVCYFDFKKPVNLINEAYDKDDELCGLNSDIRESKWKTKFQELNSKGKENSSFIPESEPEYKEKITLLVRDLAGQKSEITKTYTMRISVLPNFSCCIGECTRSSDFRKCDDPFFKELTVKENTILYLRDDITLEDRTIQSPNEPIVSRKWTYNYIEGSSRGSVFSVPIKQGGEITLEVCGPPLICNTEIKKLNNMFGKIKKESLLDFREVPF